MVWPFYLCYCPSLLKVKNSKMMNIKISTMMLCHYTCQNSTTTEILIEALEASVFTLIISSHLNVARPLINF